MKESGWELYKQGETVSGFELSDEASLEHYEDIFQDVKSERAIAQFDFEREVFITKLPRFIAVIPDPEKEHLARKEEPKKGITITHSWGRYEGR